MTDTLAFISGIGWQELLIILVIALLIFGRRLPEVGKSLGKGIVEFKKGLKGIEDDMDEVERDIDRSASSSKQAHLEANAGYDDYDDGMDHPEQVQADREAAEAAKKETT